MPQRPKLIFPELPPKYRWGRPAHYSAAYTDSYSVYANAPTRHMKFTGAQIECVVSVEAHRPVSDQPLYHVDVWEGDDQNADWVVRHANLSLQDAINIAAVMAALGDHDAEFIEE